MLRNIFYDIGIIRSQTYPFPVINIGNLCMGGTGKTPMVEYLLRLLSGRYKTATLSRGYKRETKGFVLAKTSTSWHDIGDEPCQYATKFHDVDVTVCENRNMGVKKILHHNAQTQCVILDDAFQHRAIKAGLNILLTDYNHLYCDDYLIPSGTLREYTCGAKRAQIVIITKCPENISDSGKLEIIDKLKIRKN